MLYKDKARHVCCSNVHVLGNSLLQCFPQERKATQGFHHTFNEFKSSMSVIMHREKWMSPRNSWSKSQFYLSGSRIVGLGNLSHRAALHGLRLLTPGLPRIAGLLGHSTITDGWIKLFVYVGTDLQALDADGAATLALIWSSFWKAKTSALWKEIIENILTSRSVWVVAQHEFLPLRRKLNFNSKMHNWAFNMVDRLKVGTYVWALRSSRVPLCAVASFTLSTTKFSRVGIHPCDSW